MRFSLLAAALAAPALAVPSTSASDASDALTEPQRAQAVVNAFNFAFNNYWRLCSSHDQLNPVSNTCVDPR
jgi:hypothetical protein